MRSAPHWHVLSSWFVLVVSSWDPLPTGGPQRGTLTCHPPPWPGRGPQGRSRRSAGSWCGLRCCSPAPSARGRACVWGEQAQRQPHAAMSHIPVLWGWQRGQTWQARAPFQPLEPGKRCWPCPARREGHTWPQEPPTALLCPPSTVPPGPIPQRPQLLPGVGVPHDDTGVIGGGDKEGRVRREVARHHTALVPLQPPDEGVGSHAPQQRLRDTGRC